MNISEIVFQSLCVFHRRGICRNIRKMLITHIVYANNELLCLQGYMIPAIIPEYINVYFIHFNIRTSANKLDLDRIYANSEVSANCIHGISYHTNVKHVDCISFINLKGLKRVRRGFLRNHKSLQKVIFKFGKHTAHIFEDGKIQIMGGYDPELVLYYVSVLLSIISKSCNSTIAIKSTTPVMINYSIHEYMYTDFKTLLGFDGRAGRGSIKWGNSRVRGFDATGKIIGFSKVYSDIDELVRFINGLI